MTETSLPYGTAPHAEFEAQYCRVFEAAECRTQKALAALLDIKQSSVADAKKRRAIPSYWLVKLLAVRSVNPDWIKTGSGPKFLAPSHISEDVRYSYDALPPLRAIDATIVRDILRCFPLNDLVDELRRRR